MVLRLNAQCRVLRSLYLRLLNGRLTVNFEPLKVDNEHFCKKKKQFSCSPYSLSIKLQVVQCTTSTCKSSRERECTTHTSRLTFRTLFHNLPVVPVVVLLQFSRSNSENNSVHLMSSHFQCSNLPLS